MVFLSIFALTLLKYGSRFSPVYPDSTVLSRLGDRNESCENDADTCGHQYVHIRSQRINVPFHALTINFHMTEDASFLSFMHRSLA